MKKIIAILFLSTSLIAQEGSQVPAPIAPPPLTDLQKLQIMNAAQSIEILELRLVTARMNLQQLMKESVPAGYQLNEKMELVAAPPPPK